MATIPSTIWQLRINYISRVIHHSYYSNPLEVTHESILPSASNFGSNQRPRCVHGQTCLTAQDGIPCSRSRNICSIRSPISFSITITMCRLLYKLNFQIIFFISITTTNTRPIILTTSHNSIISIL